MSDEHCSKKLEELSNLVNLKESFMVFLCVINFAFSIVAIFGNALAIRALQKASSIPATLKTLFLSLAVSDVGVGLIVQPMFASIIAVMINTAGNGSFEFLCPNTLTIFLFLAFFLATASLLLVTAIALDRVLALYLHLRYQAIVTPRRVLVFSVILWATSCLSAVVFVFLPSHSDMVVLSVEVPGLLVATVAYFQINRVVRHHQNQIQSQQQIQNDQAIDLARVKKSAFNTVYVYFLFLACYLPAFCSSIVKTALQINISILCLFYLSAVLAFINSSLNPFIYCWRYQEIRDIMKTLLKKIFIDEQEA